MSLENEEELLKLLEEHYKEPVYPLSKFCDAIRTWFRCIEKLNEENPGRDQHGSSYYRLLRQIELDITKSNLLFRLLYEKQSLREHKCPIHKGHWSGISLCPKGCASTGWLNPKWPKEAPPCGICGEPSVARQVTVGKPIEFICYNHYIEKGWPEDVLVKEYFKKIDLT